ncbi:MAG: NAD(P)H-hydrate dehydratase [Haloarculaceae archaeon]
MITGTEMAVVDANAAALGVPRKQLMESAGNAVARVVRQVAGGDEGGSTAGEANSRPSAAGDDEAGTLAAGTDVAVVAGRGNNGGDALVAARYLDDLDVVVHLLGRADGISSRMASENWSALREADCDLREVRDSTEFALGDPNVVVDGLLGTGISGAIREPAATAATDVNDSAAAVVAVDVPSGLNTETGEVGAGAVAADHVVTFHEAKPGLDDLDADVTVADIGIPRAATRFVGPGDLLRLDRDPRSHKGDHGEVLVVGGGPYAGAPALAAQAALRAGADLVRVACPAGVAHEIQTYAEDLIVRRFDGHILAPQHVGQIMELAAGHDALVVGPGAGDQEATLEAIEGVLSAFDGTAVVDADALQVVPGIETTATLVCTPHQGELVDMGGPSADDWEERAERVAAFAAELGHTLLVKGHYDVISDGESTRVGRTGNPGMTVGGTGDVLAGATGALAAVLDPMDAAAVAAWVNGRTGDRVVDENGYGLLASDLLAEIPQVLWGERPGW